MKNLRNEDTWWPGSATEQSGSKSYVVVVVLDDGRVWKRHVDHVRRDSMDSAVSGPTRELTRERESLDHPSEVPQAVPISAGSPGQSQGSPEIPASVPVETESAQSQAREEAPAATEKSAPAGTQCWEIVSTSPRRSSRVRKAPDRLIKSI